LLSAEHRVKVRKVLSAEQWQKLMDAMPMLTVRGPMGPFDGLD